MVTMLERKEGVKIFAVDMGQVTRRTKFVFSLVWEGGREKVRETNWKL